MFNFFKDSIRELKHVVWPTKLETKKYFIIVLTVLVFFWLYLFLASTIFSEMLFFLKWLFWSNLTDTNFQNIDFNSIVVNTGALTDTWSIESTWSLIETWSIVK